MSGEGKTGAKGRVKLIYLSGGCAQVVLPKMRVYVTTEVPEMCLAKVYEKAESEKLILVNIAYMKLEGDQVDFVKSRVIFKNRL